MNAERLKASLAEQDKAYRLVKAQTQDPRGVITPPDHKQTILSVSISPVDSQY